MTMSSFIDEYAKIAASKREAGYQQTRKGKRPIRAHNLLKKAEAPPIAAAKAAGGLKGLLGRMWASPAKKPLGLLAGGAVAGKAGEEYLLEPLQYGYRARSAGAQF
jgi:hypothetical protein